MSFASRRWPAMMAGRRKALYGLAALLAILLIGGALGASSLLSGRAEPVAAYVVDRGDIEKTVLATGILKPSVQVNVGAQVNGQLKKLYVRVGERVTHRGSCSPKSIQRCSRANCVSLKRRWRVR